MNESSLNRLRNFNKLYWLVFLTPDGLTPPATTTTLPTPSPSTEPLDTHTQNKTLLQFCREPGDGSIQLSSRRVGGNPGVALPPLSSSAPPLCPPPPPLQLLLPSLTPSPSSSLAIISWGAGEQGDKNTSSSLTNWISDHRLWGSAAGVTGITQQALLFDASHYLTH